MITIEQGIEVGPGIIIGLVDVFVETTYFITENDNFLVSEVDQNFIEE